MKTVRTSGLSTCRWYRFSFIQNDNNPGLQVLINNVWYDLFSNNGDNGDYIYVVGGSFVPIWTNNYWKSIVHRVLSYNEYPDRRNAFITLHHQIWI